MEKLAIQDTQDEDKKSKKHNDIRKQTEGPGGSMSQVVGLPNN